MITPDQAQTLLDGATPGPWKKRRDRDGTPIAVVVSAGPTDRHHIMTAEPACSEERAQADTGLIAAAPALAQTIAGMKTEYAVQTKEGSLTQLYYGRDLVWTDTKLTAEQVAHEIGGTVVRRYVTAPEVVDGE
ncbi:hypothetical protein [Corynebacterium nuruki]|uniref:hypothetical protein n=1 Tax=Corynebacterium nuruki TaxID=1032851 RepID=UPI0002485E2F|nr:hypothetical protein [Corynebacterium nuruki]